MKAYFLSDLHLKSVNERNGRTLLRFLNSLLEEKDKTDFHLFFLGDIFDLWVSGHTVFIRKFYPLIAPIKELISQGAKVYFFEGNHDLHIKPYWEQQLGVRVYTEAKYFKLGPWNVRCEHGDQINLEDVAYQRLRSFLRHPTVENLGHKVPGIVWEKVGNFLSQTSRQYSSAYREEKEQELIKMIRQHAHRVFKEEEFDFIISGHMHVRDDYSFKSNGKEVRSINLGSWFEEPKILKLTNSGLDWVSI